MALDASVGIGREDEYGALAADVEGYEGQADSWKTTREFIESVGFRAGMQTARADRRNIVNMGGEGELEVDLLDAGAGSLLAAAFDKVTVTEVDGVRTTVAETSAVSERSEEHTSERQSREKLVCRLLLEKKKNKY